MTFSREKSFEAIVKTVVDAIVVCNKHNEIRYFNPGAEKLLGWKSIELIGKDLTIIIPERYREMHKAGMKRYLDTRVPKVLGTPFVFLPCIHKDGHEIQTNISIATWDEDNETFFTWVIRDVTETIEHTKSQALLIKELNHRVKNTLAIVQSIVMQASKSTNDVEGFRDDIESRLMGLAGVHDLLVDTNWSHTTVINLIEKFLKPYGFPYFCQGTVVQLSPRVAVSMGMAIHELATNCVKYGAWSEGGKVSITSNIVDDQFIFIWKETGGPMIVEPKRKGFGMSLLTRVVSRSLMGQSKCEFEPNGFRFELQAPVSKDIKLGD